MPLPDCQRCIAQLEREIVKRQRQAHALGAERSFPLEVVLGVKVVRHEAPIPNKVERERRVSA
jgi:hypothetical protein